MILIQSVDALIPGYGFPMETIAAYACSLFRAP